ncbi:MAG: trimeric intracellular cation channel family protein [Verrucomicrobia bacterium]|nr:trimeric intracellular cation channel family protein [Verrucomicrobiota bacterium]
MDSVIHILDLIGTAVFAITGALVAGRKRMDTFGVVILGCVTAVGGGTLRDVVLGCSPVFWISSPHYLAIATIAAIGTFVVVHRWRLPEMLLAYADAVGLAVFTVIGFQAGFQTTHSYGISIVMGMTTGVVGGIVRDVLAGEIPLIFHKEIYASASLAGATLLALSTRLQGSTSLAILLSILTTLGIRLAALHWNLTLPVFHPKERGKSA